MKKAKCCKYKQVLKFKFLTGCVQIHVRTKTGSSLEVGTKKGRKILPEKEFFRCRPPIKIIVETVLSDCQTVGQFCRGRKA
jgi:hypothetical protein